jgi:hypothetical protein
MMFAQEIKAHVQRLLQPNLFVYKYMFMYIYLHCIYIYMDACMHACTYVYMYVCMYVCMRARVCVWMYVVIGSWTYIHVHIVLLLALTRHTLYSCCPARLLAPRQPPAACCSPPAPLHAARTCLTLPVATPHATVATSPGAHTPQTHTITAVPMPLDNCPRARGRERYYWAHLRRRQTWALKEILKTQTNSQN